MKKQARNINKLNLYTQDLRNAITNQRECMKHSDPICPDGKYYKGE